jgi:hypothetical protein
VASSHVESVAIGSEFGRWFASELEERDRLVAPDGSRVRYEFGEFVPSGEWRRVPLAEFQRSPGKVIDGVTRGSVSDNPAVGARLFAGFVEVAVGSVRALGAGLDGFVIGLREHNESQSRLRVGLVVTMSTKQVSEGGARWCSTRTSCFCTATTTTP